MLAVVGGAALGGGTGVLAGLGGGCLLFMIFRAGEDVRD